MQDYFVEQAAYQHWASTEVFNALDTLDDAQRHQDLKLFFHSIHKTVDHILVVTRNWRARLTGQFGDITAYNKVLYKDWSALKSAVLEEFADMKSWLEYADSAWFGSSFEYPNSSGQTQHSSVSDALTHIMTHAVHHRGQLSAACTRLGAPSPEMDFVFYRRHTRS